MSNQNQLYPLKFTPIFKDYVWGGRSFETQLGRAIPDGIVAESWEIAAHANGSTAVSNGPLAGVTLPQLLEQWGVELVGSRNASMAQAGRFPLLIKLLDANRWLSVQVHPEDAYALENESDLGKTEMWIVLHAEPGAEIIYGFKAGVDEAAFAQALAEDRCEEWLHRLPIQNGDVVMVPAGSIHALGPGTLVAEIQQNSDTTYRIYDWGRENTTTPRPIHIEQALAVLDFELVEPGVSEPEALNNAPYGPDITAQIIGHCTYFHTERLEVTATESVTIQGSCNGETFEIWAVLSGEAEISWHDAQETLQIHSIEWLLLPATVNVDKVAG